MGAKRCSGQRNKEKASTVEQLAYRFQGFPTRTQEHILNQFIGSVCFLWNRMLGDWIGSYKEKGKSDPIRTPSSYKQEPGLEWLKDMDSLALCNVQQNFERAVSEFFSGEKGFLRFKKKHACKDSYTTNLSNKENPNLFLEGCMLKLPKVKEPVVLRLHREVAPGGILKNCTVTREPDGRWYFSLVYEYTRKDRRQTRYGASGWICPSRNCLSIPMGMSQITQSHTAGCRKRSRGNNAGYPAWRRTPVITTNNCVRSPGCMRKPSISGKISYINCLTTLSMTTISSASRTLTWQR